MTRPGALLLAARWVRLRPLVSGGETPHRNIDIPAQSRSEMFPSLMGMVTMPSWAVAGTVHRQS